ncbi:TolB-like translocation protein [Streptomyces albireticuli]|uniref:TolB-like translocation protein n=1 Tax=Streptomyces albireticuli TaxID=1940 RepID=A0A2A2D054_9ACTN|nr:TolB-like translocation protein [Streptomyces albireticuli]MCD9141222.1 TolB-like translocation protein [Streptomyces albireticuli]MCD9160817.1 TolB-like translocation protein [Streptomyces albireticuli]MCD9191126.1 TolB-like translocation protein [Streptomyces albireticuli]PAU44837.1 TolB-like translocation protein [Streptomyces albireticuli]
MSRKSRVLILLVAVLVLGGVAVGATLHAAGRAAEKDRVRSGGPAVRSGEVALDAPGVSVFQNMAWGPHRDEIASVPAGDPAGPRTSSGVRCLRFHTAGGTGVCLRAVRGGLRDTYRAVVLDARLRETHRYDLAGVPSRARVSPGGRSAAWTVFVSGDSYAGTAFSTRTSVLDLRTGHLDRTLEDYRFFLDGRPRKPVDLNLWGVTFADDTRFYATAATGGRTYLVRGDRAARTLRTVHTNVECPSLSPDGTRIAYKKRVEDASSDAPWRLYVLDLRTLRETPTAERRSVDDQAVWRDGGTLVYSLPGDYGSDLWTVPADGSGSPSVSMRAALAPAFTAR